MSTSPISFSSGLAQAQGQSRAQQITQDFKQLAKSLQSGDLGGAQQAYRALQQLLPGQTQNGQPSGASASSSNPIGSDFQALGQALQSGDLSSAQNAFSQLQNDLTSASQNGTASSLTQGVSGRHHHHHASSTADSSSSSSSASATDAGSPSGSSGQTVSILA